MLEYIKTFIVAIGGGTVALIGLLTIFKGLFVKLFESMIESSFEKSLAKFKNRLERSTKAYEILLDREMRFYERIEPIVAELVPVSHDLLYHLKHIEGEDREKECETYREYFKKYGELINKLKNETLIHQSYIPSEIFIAFTEVVSKMQKDIQYWFEMAEFLFANESDKIDYDKGKEKVDELLKLLAVAEMYVKKRLKQLCEET